MTDYPIIFSTPMVLALLSGRKTMTRRLAWRTPRVFLHWGDDRVEPIMKPSPWQKVRPGDRLWVREKFHPGATRPHYAEEFDGSVFVKFISPIHMRREHSRLTLTVTETKIERLQEISADDVVAEGIDPAPHKCGCERCTMTAGYCPATALSLVMEFAGLWDSLHGPDAWSADHEVVALSFTVEKRNIRSMGASC